ncbi:MAG TPA: YceI family protein [Acidobacteriaceae bacterium]|nr:YceI family protein [Acidobacteriaceae bacterium]
MRTFKNLAQVTMLAGAFLTAGQALAQHSTYAIDPAHSQVDFGIKHMGISTVHGRFAIKEGTIDLDDKNLAGSAVAATIDVSSVDTGVAQRDAHLRSPDFFDTTKFPTATFKSTKITQTGEGYDVIGDLTLHGVTKPVTLHMEAPSKEQIGMDKMPHRGFTATTTLHRQDFGLTWNGTLKSGDSMLGDDVKMEFDIEAAKK